MPHRVSRRPMKMLKLVQTQDGWAIDHEHTTERDTILDLFGTTILPLPLTRRASREDALAFARNTDAGREHGVTL